MTPTEAAKEIERLITLIAYEREKLTGNQTTNPFAIVGLTCSLAVVSARLAASLLGAVNRLDQRIKALEAGK